MLAISVQYHWSVLPNYSLGMRHSNYLVHPQCEFNTHFIFTSYCVSLQLVNFCIFFVYLCNLSAFKVGIVSKMKQRIFNHIIVREMTIKIYVSTILIIKRDIFISLKKYFLRIEMFLLFKI